LWHTKFHCRCGRLRLKCVGTRAETRFRLSAKGTSPFKSAGASVQSTTGSRGVRISGSNAGYTMFRGSVKSTGHQLYSPVSHSLPLPASPCAITFQLDSTALSRQGQKIICAPVLPRPALGLTESPSQWIPVFFAVGKAAGA
jgi:hypothetical protein